MLRRLMNQVIFTRLLIRSDNIECELQPVFGHITRLGRGCRPPAKARRPRNGQDPRLFGGLGSNVDTMVRMRGLEPPPGFPDTDLNRARLPIPPHPRAARRARIPYSDRWPGGRAQPLSGSALLGRSRPVGLPPGALLASSASLPAAIVQGTRTPPSHGGNPGSNPGSGTGLIARMAP